MKKFIVMTLTVLLICMTAAGCGQSSETPADGTAQTENSSAEVPAASDVQPGQAGGLSTSYTAYLNAKSDLINRMATGLGDSQPAAAMELLGMNMVEMYMVPMAALGVDETYAEAMLSYLNAADVKYTADGNHYAVSYKGADGVEVACETTYDPGKEAATTKISQSGKEALIFEYAKTSYGYASQYFIKNDDGTYSIYKGTFYGKDGVLGLSSETAAQPESIIGKGEVSKDFPKDCESWFKAEGSAGTGVGPDGTTYDFTVPAEASN